MWLKKESVLNTHPTNAYTKFETNWVIPFPDDGQKPWMEGHMDTQMFTIPMSPPDFIGEKYFQWDK